jgi:hypothetical protein
MGENEPDNSETGEGEMDKSNGVDLSQAVWRKGERGGGQNVEVATNLAGGLIALRDGRNPAGPALIFTPDEWKAFVGGVQDGEFDL